MTVLQAIGESAIAHIRRSDEMVENARRALDTYNCRDIPLTMGHALGVEERLHPGRLWRAWMDASKALFRD